MYIQPMTLAILLALFSLVILAIAAASAWRGLGIRVNLLCVVGILLSAVGAGYGWEYQLWDIGWNTGWVWFLLGGAFVSLVTPLGGFVQVLTLLSDFGFGYEGGVRIVGAEWFVLAVLGSVLVVESIVTPLGVNLNRKNADTIGRLLTVSPSNRLNK